MSQQVLYTAQGSYLKLIFHSIQNQSAPHCSKHLITMIEISVLFGCRISGVVFPPELPAEGSPRHDHHPKGCLSQLRNGMKRTRKKIILVTLAESPCLIPPSTTKFQKVLTPDAHIAFPLKSFQIRVSGQFP